MLFIINFKANIYGEKAVKLAKICEQVAKKHKANIAVAVQPTDILAVAASVDIPVLAQHVDAITPGSHTGWILPEAVSDAGACGSLINHSEHKHDQMREVIRRLRSSRLLSVACTPTPNKAKDIVKLKPDIIAIEPPALIGTKNSVSKKRPKVISDTVKVAGGIPVLCGAGIHTKEDVKIARQLGAQGVLIASAITKAKDPKKALEKLL
ncbi:triose-phosphate isomerase [Candidatus Woesearchaeota archaeon]|nr:triose-phosphate isomerase [Candidatus Woesearchaeota archaeon]